MFSVIIFFRNPLISLAVVRENSYTYYQELILLNILSFLEHAIRLWNHLLDHIVKPDVNIDSFKCLLTS